MPRGTPAFSEREAAEAAAALGGGRWVVKAQVHAGGRGKAGGVKLVDSIDAVGVAAGQLLGSRLVTAQTGAAGLPVNAVLVEEVRPIAQELYLSVLVDRSSARVLFLASSAGGMDIEEVAAQHPEKILSLSVDPTIGLQATKCREIGFSLGLGRAGRHLDQDHDRHVPLFMDKDLSQIEINPLVVTEDGALLVLDAKINVDDNALFAHPDLAELRDPSQEDPKESVARSTGLAMSRWTAISAVW